MLCLSAIGVYWFNIKGLLIAPVSPELVVEQRPDSPTPAPSVVVGDVTAWTSAGVDCGRYICLIDDWILGIRSNNVQLIAGDS